MSLWNFFVPLGVFLFLDIALLIPWTILFPLEWREEMVCDMYVVMECIIWISDRGLVMTVIQRFIMNIARAINLVIGLEQYMCTKDC